MAWKTLKDLLFYEGYEETTPREVWRRGFEVGHMDKAAAETSLDALDKRDILSHAYDEEAAKEAVDLIKTRYAPMLGKLLAHLRGKRGSA